MNRYTFIFILFFFGLVSFSQNGYPVRADSLTINYVNGIVTNIANQAFNPSFSKYRVPSYVNSSPLFASSLWLGGYHNGQLHLSAMTYQSTNRSFWPGPLDTIVAKTDTISALPFTYMWKVNRFDIANFIYNWNAGNVQSGAFVPPNSILNWPAHGTGNYSRNLAPFVDVNNDGVYNPIGNGDYPLMKGDQMVWWVFNDSAGRAFNSGANAFGIEVHACAYAFICPNIEDSNRVLNYTTFYNYELINRSQQNYDSCRIGLWVDADLGFYLDDYIGCDVANNFGFTYNGDGYDEDVLGFTGYHNDLPSFSSNILNGPLADPADGIDNDNNGIIDEANEKCLMTNFVYYTNSGDLQTGNPSSTSPIQFNNYIKGNWRNGTRVTFGGGGTSGISSSNPVCRHVFPGSSDPYGVSLGGSIANPISAPAPYNNSVGWTEASAGILKNDMRFLIGMGPFSMQPGGSYQIDFAYVFSQDSVNCGSGDNDCIFPRMQQDNNRVRDWFNANSFPSCLSLAGVGIKENYAIDPKVYPNPAEDLLYVELKDPGTNLTIEIYDILGKLMIGSTHLQSQKYIAIPIEKLQKGSYIIKVKSNDGCVSKKFVKE